MTQPTITRAHAPYTPSWQRFHEFAAPLASSSGAGSAAASSSGQHPYARQYSHVYSARLAALRERCLDNAKASLKDDMGINEEDVSVADRIIEVKEGVWSILVGTIVKEVDSKRRPAVNTSYNDAADAQNFLFPTEDDKQGEKKQQESLRAYLFDSEKGDVLHLEDESGRVELEPEEPGGADTSAMDVDGGGSSKNVHALNPNRVATGVVAAVVGKVCATKGVMQVHSIHFAGPPPADGTPASKVVELRGATVDEGGGTTANDDDEPILLLISGLGCGSDSPTDADTGASLALRREMLLEYLTDPAMGNGASVCRVIVAGGGVSAPTAAKGESECNNKENSSSSKKNYNSIANNSRKNDASAAVSEAAFSLRELDLYLSEILSCGIPVDYLPGMHDPTNANWPQRPMHSCLLPLSCEFADLFSRATNPYEGILGGGGSNDKKGKEGGVRVLGSDGLNIADLRRFLAKSPSQKEKEESGDDKAVSSATSCVDALNQTLIYGHMAPTGPDSLPTFPSSESDPFVLKYRPSVYFAGNSDKFETRLVDENGDTIDEAGIRDGQSVVTRILSVPSFARTGEVVLIKLRTLECEVISFDDASL